MNDELQSKLLDAIENHDEILARRMLADGADPNLPAQASPSWYPLHAAVSELPEGGPIGIVKALLECGANANNQDDAGNTPLLIAARDESWEAALMLLDAGADPSVRNIDNVSSLSLAVEVGNEDVVRKMISTGMCRKDINAWIGFSGLTMLGLAAKRLDVEVIQLLISAGADIYAMDDKYKLAIENLPPVDETNAEKWHRAAHLLSDGRP